MRPSEAIQGGAWANFTGTSGPSGGMHIPTGTKVTFQALGETGVWHSQGYIWPSATPTSGCP